MFSSEGLFLVCALCVIFFSFTVQYREIAVLVAKLLFQCSDPVLVNENCEDIRYFIHIGLLGFYSSNPSLSPNCLKWVLTTSHSFWNALGEKPMPEKMQTKQYDALKISNRQVGLLLIT